MDFGRELRAVNSDTQFDIDDPCYDALLDEGSGIVVTDSGYELFNNSKQQRGEASLKKSNNIFHDLPNNNKPQPLPW